MTAGTDVVCWRMIEFELLQLCQTSSSCTLLAPSFVAYKAIMNAMLEIRRLLLGQHGRKIWKTHVDAFSGIIRIVNHWEGVVKALGCPPAETNEILEEFHAPSYWRIISPYDPQLIPSVDAEITAHRAAMHGRKRNDMRKCINRWVAIPEASREAGKLGRVIKSVLGTQTERFLMT